MKRATLVFPFSAILLSSLVMGCSSSSPSGRSSHEERPTAANEKSYKLIGEVRGVDRASGEVTIRHEAIPGYMAAMTMPFTVKDRESLEDLKVGDEVEGTLKVRAGDSELVDLTITSPALGPEIKVAVDGLMGGKPLEPGQEMPDFAVTTQNGQTLRLSDLRGKVVVLTFIYTRCPQPDFCPRMDATFADVASQVRAKRDWAERVRLLSISFDPDHDTPDVLSTHAKLRGAQPPLWQFAVASHAELRKVAGPLGLMYDPSTREISHNLVVVVIGPDGRLARRETGREGNRWTLAGLLRAMKPLVESRK